MWIIKTFWNVYLQDNYHFKDLNIKKKKKGLIFRIWIKNSSKYNSRLKKSSKNESKLDQTQMRVWHPRVAIGHSWSAHWHKFEARLGDPLIKIRPIFFGFLEIRTCSNSYLIIQLIFRSIPTSINRGCLSKLSTLSDPPLSGSSLLNFQFHLR